MKTILFKRQLLGKWRRDDGESRVMVNERAMNREIEKLLNDGWHMNVEGKTIIRGVTMTKG
jgi:hypothetical protein